MLQSTNLKDEVSKPQTFGALTIERRVLLMKNETISIPSIASIVVREWTEVNTPSLLLAIIGAGFASMIFGSLIVPQARTLDGVTLSIIIVFGLFLGLVWAIREFMTQRTVFRRLVVFTNDGRATYFSAPDVRVLEKVRRVLSDKINAHDEAATYNINLEKGIIESLNVGMVDSIGAVVTGDSNQVVVGQGRIGTTEVTNSTGVQIGQGNTWQGDAVNMVDYSRFIPTITEWSGYYGGLGHRDIAAKLDQLEQLMRAGSPTPAEKGTVRDLVTDLGKIIGGTGEVAHFFSMIARAAGF